MKQDKQPYFKSIVIGAGASGLMCAAHIADDGSVLILEKQSQIAAKVKISGGVFICENLIVASGGVSYPKIGATDLGYKIAGQFGHKIINPHPALVGLVAPAVIRSFFSELAGIFQSVSFNVA